MTSLAGMRFDNHFARLGSRFSTTLPPTPLPAPYLVSANPDAAALIDLDPDQLLTPEQITELVDYLSTLEAAEVGR